MKKITLLFALCLFSLGYSQVVLTEDFESSTTIPATWTNNDIAGNGELWLIESTGSAALAADGNTLVYDGGAAGNYAAFNSDAYGDNGFAENAALESPVFDCSSLTTVNLKFNHAFAGNYGGNGFVEILNGDEANPTWVEVEAFSGDNYQIGEQLIDLTDELAGVTNAQVRFRWTGDWSVAWYVDNIEVFECTDAAPGIATNPMPADAASNVVVTTTDNNETQVSFSWDTPATGGPVTDYLIVIGDNPALDPQGNTISGTIGSNNPGNILLPNDTFFEVSTTYYWTVIPQNCAGSPTTNPTVWSFTTASTLSNTEIEAEKVLEHFVSNNTLSIRANNQIDQVEIYNMLGQAVHTCQPKSNSSNIALNTLNSGMFIAKVTIEGQTQTFKFVK